MKLKMPLALCVEKSESAQSNFFTFIFPKVIKMNDIKGLRSRLSQET